jgi:hypothetical protein
VPIGGATSSTYTAGAGDVGRVVRAVVTGANMYGFAAAQSNSSATVVTSVPANSVVPTISGSPTNGSLLTAGVGTWSGTPSSYGYQWERCTTSTSTFQPTLRAVSTGQQGRAFTPEVVTANTPAGTQQGDVMVAVVEVSANITSINSAPAGWTLVSNQNSPGPNSTALAVYYKVAGVAESGPYTWNVSTAGSDTSNVVIDSYQGINNTTPVNQWTLVGVASGTSAATSSITTTVNGALVISAFTIDSEPNRFDDWTLAGPTRRADVHDGMWEALNVFDEIQPAAGAITRTATHQYASDAVTLNLALTPDCVPVTGATASTYTLSGADVGTYVRVAVTGTNAFGTGAAAGSAATVAVT